MEHPVTAIARQTSVSPLPREEATALASALGTVAGAAAEGERHDDALGVVVHGTEVALPPTARRAVAELLRRLAAGEGVEMHASHAWLTTAQAARLAGISETYLRNLSAKGVIPVTYRGTHRRYRDVDILTWASRNGRGE